MDQWHFVYDEYDPEQEGRREALCTLGNGLFATRAATPDSSGDDIHYPGTYLAGGYNRLTTKIGGGEMENEDLVNLPNWLPLTFRIDDGAWFRLDEVEILSYRQELDLKVGLLRRNIRFRDNAGRTTALERTAARQHGAATPRCARSRVDTGRLGRTADGPHGPRRASPTATCDIIAIWQVGIWKHWSCEHVVPDMIFLRARTNQS